MPLHDWTRVPPGWFHDFHQVWTIEIRRVLNSGILPEGFYAFAEQRISGPEPDVIALRLRGPEPTGGMIHAETPPRLKRAARGQIDKTRYADKANRIIIREGLGRVVAVIEIVSPGDKHSEHATSSFVDKAVQFVSEGIHLLMVDLFPPGRRDPEGLTALIWNALTGESLSTPTPSDRRSVAAIEAGDDVSAYVEVMPVGGVLPDAPLFLAPGWYVNVPLEATYLASWDVTPAPVRELLVQPQGADS